MSQGVPGVAFHKGLAEAPPVTKTCPAVPGARVVHPVALQYNISPCVKPKALPNIAASVCALGTAVIPLILAKTDPVTTVAKDTVPVLVIGPPVNPAPVATLVTVPAFCA